jgi:PH (Pleckstrin Homology) domain-containing protein
MSYVDKNLVPGETLLYQTRHHWIVLFIPVLVSLVLAVPGVYLLGLAFEERGGNGLALGSSTISPQGMAIVGTVLLAVGIVTLSYGVIRRNATEMAVTTRRVLIKTGMGSRRTLDLMLGRVESIGVQETVFGRMVGYGTVIVRGTGGTPETFEKIAHPQDFRKRVQEQISAQA